MHEAADDSLPVVVEFLDKRDSVWSTALSKAEVVITGPMTKEISAGLHRIWVDVFVIVSSSIRTNNYDHIDKVGIFANALDQCIVCKDYGATNELIVGTLRPRPEAGDTIKTTHLKPSEKDTQIHSTVAARFLGYFSE